MLRAAVSAPETPPEPPADCTLCPRLVSFRHRNQELWPDWFNGAVPSFGNPSARVLIVGLAPGLQGANRTGRPFTGDYAGDLLYRTLSDFGLACGEYQARANDGFTLVDCMITNAVRCVPPENKPIGQETRTCRSFLRARIASLPNLRAIVALGRTAHDSVLSALNAKRMAHPFTHGARHRFHDGPVLFDSYHCSRYNTNTGVLTEQMFRDVFEKVTAELAERPFADQVL